MALALLSALAPEKLAQAIAAQDRTALVQADGVGPELANRLVTRVEGQGRRPSHGGGPVAAGPDGRRDCQPPASTNDAVSALVNLGYRRAEAFTAVAQPCQKAGPDAKPSEG